MTNRARLENVIHPIFNEARLEIDIEDKIGQPVAPPKWFLVPLFINV